MSSRGFALVDLLVSLAILGLVLAGLLILQQQGQTAYLMGAARVEAQQSARTALDLFTHEIRLSRAVTAVAAGCGNPAVGADDITFDFYDQATATWVPVRYRRTGTTLERTYNGAASVLAGGVRMLRILCYDVAGLATSVPADVRSVAVTLSLDADESGTGGSVTHQLMAADSRVRLRNAP
jgi:type II secretory pathway pseudopilin PulG